MPDNQGRIVLSESLSSADASRALQQSNESAARTAPPVSERRGLRLAFEPPRMFMDLLPKDGPAAKVVVYPRNLSTRGIAVMHRAYVHQGLPCRILLPRLAGDWVRFEGQVVRCSHVTGRAHEVAVQFHRALRLAEYLVLDKSEAGRAAEEYEYFRRQPSPVADRAMKDKWPGAAAVVAGKEFNLDVLRTWLNFVGMQVLTVDTVEQALLIRQSLRLVAVPAEPDLLQAARDRGLVPPLVAVADADDSDTYERSIAAGADAFVSTRGEFGDLTCALQALGKPSHTTG